MYVDVKQKNENNAEKLLFSFLSFTENAKSAICQIVVLKAQL